MGPARPGSGPAWVRPGPALISQPAAGGGRNLNPHNTLVNRHWRGFLKHFPAAFPSLPPPNAQARSRLFKILRLGGQTRSRHHCPGMPFNHTIGRNCQTPLSVASPARPFHPTRYKIVNLHLRMQNLEGHEPDTFRLEMIFCTSLSAILHHCPHCPHDQKTFSSVYSNDRLFYSSCIMIM